VVLGLSSLVGCFTKVVMVERVSTKCCSCNIQGGDSGLEVSPWLAIELDGSDVHPELGRRLCVSSRILRADWLESETPALRGWRLRSVA
jgi:hypothetical protein